MVNAFPAAQSGSDGSSIFVCLFYLVWFGGIILILMNLKSKTNNATPLSRTIQTGFAPPVIQQMAREQYRGYSVTANPNTMIFKGSYLTTGQIILLLLLGGIIPGALLYYFLMGRTEELTIDTLRWQEQGNVTLNARGIRAIERAHALISKLESQPFTGAQALVVETSSLNLTNLPPPSPETVAALNDLNNDSAKRRWVTIQKLTKEPIDNPRVVAELQRLMISDPMDYVRQEAVKALNVPLYQRILDSQRSLPNELLSVSSTG